MVIFDAMVEARRPLWIAAVLLVLMVGVSGCEQAPESAVEAETRSPAVPASPGSVEVEPDAAPGAAGSPQTLSTEEISRHFTAETTETAKAAAQAMEATGKKAEQAVDEATR